MTFDNTHFFLKINNQINYFIFNFLFSILILVLGRIILTILFSNSTTVSQIAGISFVFIVVSIVVIRSSISVAFGFNWKNKQLKLERNYEFVYLLVVLVLNLILVIYYVFYYQINALIPQNILLVIIGPILLLAFIALLFGGIENVAFSLLIGILALTITIVPSNIHHTMGEFVILFSLGSTVFFSPLYMVPSTFIGFKFPNFAINNITKKINMSRLIIISLIPVLFIFIIQFFFYVYIFSNWSSF